jgi:hypothetical protein
MPAEDAPPMPTAEAPAGPGPTAPYRYAEQHAPPEPVQVSEVAQTTFEHVYEVDPRLMERHVLQQVFPNWDTLRIMRSRHDHLDWMHRHFAEKVVTGSEILAEIEATDGGSATVSVPSGVLYDGFR